MFAIKYREIIFSLILMKRLTMLISAKKNVQLTTSPLLNKFMINFRTFIVNSKMLSKYIHTEISKSLKNINQIN